jgi:fused signal recognition particle receptor
MDWLYLVIGLAVIGLLVVAGFVVPRLRRTPLEAPTDVLAPAETDVATAPP